MLTTEDLIEKCHRFAKSEPEELNADSLIGFFQVFRPDGAELAGLFDDLTAGQQLHERLQQLYLAAGDDRRGDGGRDAYFVVRRPPPIVPDEASDLASRWLQRLAELARRLGEADLAAMLTPLPAIRVLEGLAPKHPKAEAEKSPLLKSLQNEASTLLERMAEDDSAAALRPAYYFVACDPMLRDYLMWPLYRAAPHNLSQQPIADPFEPYFRLWTHGVKYRIFSNRQVDLYLPRQSD